MLLFFFTIIANALLSGGDWCSDDKQAGYSVSARWDCRNQGAYCICYENSHHNESTDKLSKTFWEVETFPSKHPSL